MSAGSDKMLPRMIYGLAWKREQTPALVKMAVRTGFRAIDTAGQRKHYRQDLVGPALQELYAEGIVKRQDLWLQTKYTSPDGQELGGYVPYDLEAPLRDKIQQSFRQSMVELKTDYIDSFLLHGPEPTIAGNVEALLALKPFLDSGALKQIGISNIYDLRSIQSIQSELDAHNLKIAAIQNRFYEVTGYDKEIRKYCKEQGIMYQSFWTLTANPRRLKGQAILRPASRLKITPEQVMYQFCLQEGITPLNGTTSSEHAALGVKVLSGAVGQILPEEIAKIERTL